MSSNATTGVVLRVGDNGVGGADPSTGSGLTGNRARIEALGGSLVVRSPRGEGTVLDVALPVAAVTERPSASVGPHSPLGWP